MQAEHSSKMSRLRTPRTRQLSFTVPRLTSVGRVIVASSINADVSVSLEAFPRAGETVLGEDALRSLGGKGANCAVAAARCASAASVQFAGAVGAADGAHLLHGLEAYGIDTNFVQVLDGCATGVAFVFVEKRTGENRIVVSPGANARFSAAALPLAFDDSLQDAYIALNLEIRHVEAQKIAVRASEGGAHVVFNPSPVPRHGSELLSPDAHIWKSVQVLVVNQHEAEQLTGIGNKPASAAHALSYRCRPDALIIITLGAAGVFVYQNGASCTIPAFPVKSVVDTTAAGDCFTGWLCARLAAGDSALDAIEAAITAAGICVESAGASVSIPCAAEVEKRSAEQGSST